MSQWLSVFSDVTGVVGGLLLLYIGSKRLTPIHTALYRYLQPIVATIVALSRHQTKIDRTNIIGAALIFTGMLCVILFAPRHKGEQSTRE